MQGEQRGGTRSSMLKRAKITFGNPDHTHSVIDCVVMNMSATGIKARTTVPVTVPEWVTLAFPDGTATRARLRWTRGTELGFELVAQNGESLLDAMIAGLTPEQRRTLVARIEASLLAKPE